MPTVNNKWYPDAVDEDATLDLVLAGKSIARYGDGEFNLVRGGNCVSQRAHPGIREELSDILRTERKDLLVGIPRIDDRSPKISNWTKCCSHYGAYLNPKLRYYSAFITRPDSAPWVNTKEFFDKVESLWRGQEVTLVCNGVRSLKPQFLLGTGAKSVVHIECDYSQAYHQIDALERSCLQPMGVGPPRRVILCVGPTATCLAARLAPKGIHAVDLGHIGMFWRRYNETFVEQREINKATGVVEPNP